jgi:hypothetical protein
MPPANGLILYYEIHGAGMSTARLAILPGLTHYNILWWPAPASTVSPFVDTALTRGIPGPSPGYVAGPF